MSASVSIQTARKDSILTIPLQAITTRTDLIPDSVKTKMGINESMEQVFIVKEDNTVEVREITTGIQDLANIEILTGLQDNESIVIGPFSAISKTLKKGTVVSPESPDKDKEKKK
jgi:HlyD family secretion protein